MPPHTLLPPSTFPPLADGPSQPPPVEGENASIVTLNAAVVLILATLVCFVVCALAVHSSIRCAVAILGRLRELPEQPCGSDRAQRAGGGKRKVLAALPVVAYFPGLDVPRALPECAICLSEFDPGERIRVLPDCSHAFHVRCVDRWLLARPSCPTCRHSVQSRMVV